MPKRVLLARSLQRTSWQDFNKSLCNVSVQDLHKRSLGKISVQAPYKRSLGKACCRDRCAISFWELSWQDLRKRPLGKISVLYKISIGVSVQDLSVARSLRKLPRKGRLAKISGRDLTRPKCWEGCASNLKIRTAPQQERSERPKVARGLRERSPGHRFVRDFRQKRKMRELLCCKGHQIRRTPWIPPRMSSRP